MPAGGPLRVGSVTVQAPPGFVALSAGPAPSAAGNITWNNNRRTEKRTMPTRLMGEERLWPFDDSHTQQQSATGTGASGGVGGGGSPKQPQQPRVRPPPPPFPALDTPTRLNGKYDRFPLSVPHATRVSPAASLDELYPMLAEALANNTRLPQWVQPPQQSAARAEPQQQQQEQQPQEEQQEQDLSQKGDSGGSKY